jgi:hypothetical protein
MRKIVVVVALHLAVLGPLSADPERATAEIDLAEVMPAIDDATKSLDSSVAGRQPEAAALEAEKLEDLFRKVEAFFASKRDAADAVTFARRSQGLSADISRSVKAADFDGASAAVSGLVRSCKRCHEAYRKD